MLFLLFFVMIERKEEKRKDIQKERKEGDLYRQLVYATWIVLMSLLNHTTTRIVSGLLLLHYLEKKVYVFPNATRRNFPADNR